jgi:hypothetical protein
MIYRIKQISEFEYVGMCGTFTDWIFGLMEGIERDDLPDNWVYGKYTWFSERGQKAYCAVNSLCRAKEIIRKHKLSMQEKNKYPKYYRV